MSSEALNPEPVTELPLTPPAEDEEEDAAIISVNCKTRTEKKKYHKNCLCCRYIL